MDFLKHPIHCHALSQRKLSGHCNLLVCEVCKSRIHASTSIYCCERCKIYLHPSCATEIPSQIQRHPLHPDHPLTIGTGDIERYRETGKLDVDEYELEHGGYFSPSITDLCCPACERRLDECGFYCSSCPFDLHVGCAMMNLLPDEESGPEQATFEHFAHPCPLASLNVKHEYNIECEACGVQLSGEVYGCRRCVFFLHKTCAEWPQERRGHPFHSHHPLAPVFHQKDHKLVCRACRRLVFKAYRCKDCDFSLCHDCTNATLPLSCPREETQDSRPPTNHCFHQHPLAFYCSEKEMPFFCNACNQHVSGEFHGCPDCSFFVHESCVKSLSREMEHYLHPVPDHPLTLSPSPPEVHKQCRSCRDFIRGVFTYNCEACDFYLHIRCALQTLAYLEQGASKRITNLMGKYELTLVYRQASSYGTCDFCGEYCQGPAYDCEQLLLHKSCVEALLKLDPFLDPFPHQHRLVLVNDRRGFGDCAVCGESIRVKICYSCEERDFLHLHPFCVQKPTLKHPLHAHHLTYFQRKRISNSRCKACGKACAVDLYCCELCNVHIHYDCLQIPQTIKSRHIDELTLHESIVEDDSGEYYCDICERRRDPELWAYYCSVCTLIAHVACALSPVELNLVEGNPELEKLDEEIERAQKEVERKKQYLEKLMADLEELKAGRAAVAELCYHV